MTQSFAPLTKPMEVLTLGLQGEMFAIDAYIVREILDLVPVTQVPNADPFVDAVINVRGRVVPLCDLRLKFGMERRPATRDTRIVVIEIPIGGEDTIVGLLADKVFEVSEIMPEAAEAAPRIGLRWQPEFIRCVGKREQDFIIVLNVEEIFAVGRKPSGTSIHLVSEASET